MMIAWVVYVSVSSALSCQKQGVWVSGIVRISLLVFKHRLCVSCWNVGRRLKVKSDRAAAPQPLMIAEHVARADASQIAANVISSCKRQAAPSNKAPTSFTRLSKGDICTPSHAPNFVVPYAILYSPRDWANRAQWPTTTNKQWRSCDSC